MNSSDPQFWMMISSIVTAVCLVFIAISFVVAAMAAFRALKVAREVQEKVEPLIDQVKAISAQGKEIAVQFNELSVNLNSASRHFAESSELIKEEIAELKVLVGQTAIVAKNKVELVSDTIDRTQLQVTSTADFIQAKVVEPASELAAIMAGIRKALEVLFAPSPKRIDRAYHEDEMFIG